MLQYKLELPHIFASCNWIMLSDLIIKNNIWILFFSRGHGLYPGF